MGDASSYWSPICRLVSMHRWWVRIRSNAHGEAVEGRWGQLLTMPVEGYLESSAGPVPLADVEWVDISTRRVVGGIAGRPRQMVDITADVLSALRETHVTWELLEATWSLDRVFDDEPVELIRVLNP